MALAWSCAPPAARAQLDPSAPASPPVKLERKDAARLLLSKLKPEYPAVAKVNYIRGHVDIEIVVARDGRVVEAHVLHGNPILAASAFARTGLENLGETLFKTLSLMRVYTKEPTEREFSRKPFILKSGSSVHDLARSIHSDFKENFNYARVWSKRLAFSPQKVGATFKLQDGDSIEIHLK